MGVEPPYLYDAPRRESHMDMPSTFNPKAVTMASRQPPSPTRKKQEGPFISFNQHPDSFLILPYGKTDVKPMSPKVKTAVKTVRWVQFVFRLMNLLGASGAMLCSIFIKGAADTEGYIMRIPPGADIAVTLYAIYHLLRSAKSRPAGSSASYHFFAMVTDAGFIPFYVFTALLAKRNLDEEVGTPGRWRTVFPTDDETNKILLATWLIAVTVAGIHCAALCLDIWLTLIFRKIASLPPDMNPLEDTLTSRRNTKHKYKSSSTSAITPLTQEDKRFSAQTTGTMASNRDSQAAPLISNGVPSPERKQMEFMHTRTDSSMTYSPHTPQSARQSRERFSMYSQPNPHRNSRPDLNSRNDLHRDDENNDETLAQRKAMLAEKAIKRQSRPNSFVTSSSKQDFYTPPTTANKSDASGDLGMQKKRESLQSDNWFVYGEQPDESPQYKTPKSSLFPSKKQGYNTVATRDDLSDDDIASPNAFPQPLRMNPPTPPPNEHTHVAKKPPPPPSTLQRTKTKTSLSSEATFSRSPTRGSMKSRYYGDLKAAQEGVRGPSPANSPAKSTPPPPLPSAAKQYTTNASPSTQMRNSAPFSLDKKSFASVRKTGNVDASFTPIKAQSPRVVSRSGVDYTGDSSYFEEGDMGTPGRRRDVSGKVAEEGRSNMVAKGLSGIWMTGGGGMNDHGLTYRKVSGVAA